MVRFNLDESNGDPFYEEDYTYYGWEAKNISKHVEYLSRFRFLKEEFMDIKEFIKLIYIWLDTIKFRIPSVEYSIEDRRYIHTALQNIAEKLRLIREIIDDAMKQVNDLPVTRHVDLMKKIDKLPDAKDKENFNWYLYRADSDIIGDLLRKTNILLDYADQWEFPQDLLNKYVEDAETKIGKLEVLIDEILKHM